MLICLSLTFVFSIVILVVKLAVTDTDLEETLSLFSWALPTDAVQLGAARVNWQNLARFGHCL